MKQFADTDFLLNTKTAVDLYHHFAAQLPIIDYHCHLPPERIAANDNYQTLTAIWLHGDHYKWRAMRANGIDESFITGNTNDWEKFQSWAQTVPYTVRNPLYHWTHLELQRYFGIKTLLDPTSATEIYHYCNEQLVTRNYSVQNLLARMNVKIVCTTDDPTDDLRNHRLLHSTNASVVMLPTFRPDKAIHCDDPLTYNKYLDVLEAASDVSIQSYGDLLTALKNRHDYFAANGCTVADHGLEQIYADDFTEREIENAFGVLRSGNKLDETARIKLKSALLVQLAEWNFEKGWVQQYHLGALRNNNSRLLKHLGADAGADSIGDFAQAVPLAKFLDRLDKDDKLAKTILYNLNPSDNAMMSAMAGNFNDGYSPGKIQWGSAWWFLDQKDGIRDQLNMLSNNGFLSRFIGMLTDSRSFLSYPRHEYFRRILCDLLGTDIENGELPNDTSWIGKIIQDICFYNARDYFNWQPFISDNP